MSYLNKFELKNKKKHRVGRGMGSGSGKTCGKGHKGQKSRAGYSKSFTFEGGQTPLNIRLPKFGFTSKTPKKFTIASNQLKKIKDNEINIALLKKYKFIKKSVKYVKIVYKKEFDNISIADSNIYVSSKIKNILNGGGGS